MSNTIPNTHNNKHLFFILLVVVLSVASLIGQAGSYMYRPSSVLPGPQISVQPTLTPSTFATPSPTLTQLPPIPDQKTLQNNYHIFQTFNNCGPAAMSMALSYYDINESQQTLGQLLRPYQNSKGDNDDKSVTLQELVEIAPQYNLTAYRRPAGNAQTIKQFIAADIPVIARTWLKPDDDIGHFRVIKGYDQTGFIQDDSLQGKNLHYTYEIFDSIWKKYNYEYLVLVPKDKVPVAQTILGSDLDELKSWQKAVDLSLGQLQQNPDDIYVRFNLSVAYYHTGEYQKSVDEFAKVETRLPFRTLWYQIEPLESYMELKDYQKVLTLTEKILNNQNLAFSELYIMRGDVFTAQNNPEEAKRQYELALFYNKNLKAAQQRLNTQ